ncbi:2Fe-2S iron-sulfur cluster-binding protein [Sebaldella termitidis]|uniref:2Fe-2S iron-sulfur cluster-binding protein n=1 Tax=Sebaldella termitidis TaxID=826 RepID=UPI003EBB7EE8
MKHNLITLTIDHKTVEVPEGTTILAAAKSVGISIPTLCYLNLSDFGCVNTPSSCRMCLVEVEGRRNLAPACVTPAADKMTVSTNSVRALKTRKTMLELLLSDHPKDCLTCQKSGNCEL